MSGWKDGETTDRWSGPANKQPTGNPRYGRCDHQDQQGYFCGEAGAHSASTVGGGPWKCNHHFHNGVGQPPRGLSGGHWGDDLVSEMVGQRDYLSRQPGESRRDYAQRSLPAIRAMVKSITSKKIVDTQTRHG